MTLAESRVEIGILPGGSLKEGHDLLGGGAQRGRPRPPVLLRRGGPLSLRLVTMGAPPGAREVTPDQAATLRAVVEGYDVP
jgi:hypothetical protein